MKQGVIFILGLLMVSQVYSQSTFNIFLGNGDRQTLGKSILEVEQNKYLIHYTSRLSNSSDDFLVFKFIDSNRQVLDSFSYHKPGYKFISNGVLKTKTGNFLFYGSRIKSGNGEQFFLKFNPDFEELWGRGLSLNDWKCESTKVIQTLDGGFLSYGLSRKWTVMPYDSAKAYAIKFDKNRNVEWYYQPTAEGYFEEGRSVTQLPDSSYVFLNLRKTPDQGYNVLLAKVDQVGKQLWEKEILSSYSTDVRILVPAENGNLLMVGTRHQPANRDRSHTYAMMVDTAGDLLWENSYGGDVKGWLYSAFQVSDGFILGGVRNDRSEFPYEMWKKLIVKVNYEGDTIWTRYLKAHDMFDIFNFVHKIAPASDGGILVAGYSASNYFDHSITGLFMKLDSLGRCESSQCLPWPQTGIQTERGKNPEITLFPNPANDVLKIILAEEYSGYEIIDYTGRIAGSGLLHAGENVISITGLSTGVYFLRILDDDYPVAVKKFLIHYD